jgi:hypothetical protein
MRLIPTTTAMNAGTTQKVEPKGFACHRGFGIWNQMDEVGLNV